MSAEENKAIISHFYAEVDKVNLDVVDEILATNCVFHFPGGVDVSGPEGYKEYIAPFRTAFPDLKHIIKDMVAAGDKVSARFTFPGTHKSALLGIAPTGKQVVFTCIAIYHIGNGKIGEAWVEDDGLGLMQQLGAVPPLGEE